MALQPQNTLVPQDKVSSQDTQATQSSGLVSQNSGNMPQSALVSHHVASNTIFLGRGGNNHRTTPAHSRSDRDERRLYLSPSDETTLINQIREIDRSRERPSNMSRLPVDQILETIEGILNRGDNAIDIHENLDIPTNILNAISSVILCKSLLGADANKTTMDILEKLQHYDWDEKVVLALGAFAIEDGEFWLVIQLTKTDGMAKAIGQANQMQEILSSSETTLESKFKAYDYLISQVLKLTKIIVHLQYLHRDPHLTADIKKTYPANSIQTAVYWTVRSIVILASHLLGITGSDPRYATETCEMLSLTHKLESINNYFEKNLHDVNDIIQRLKDEKAFNAVARVLESSHLDNSESLGVLFNKDDQPALYDGYNKRKVDIDVLRRKFVILMISDLDIVQQNEYLIAQQMNSEKRCFPARPESQYEIVWVPIVDNWTEDKRLQFEQLKNYMEWYTVIDPSVMSSIVVRYIKRKDKWNFVKTPVFVVMDPQGKIVQTNAVHMMCIFGSAAFPFTSNRERLLWEDESWRIELLADAIDPTLLNWMSERKYICLYGGDDIEWVRAFTKATKEVALEAGIQLELLYLGMNKQKERVCQNMIHAIRDEKLSHTVDWTLTWFFWVRLESMWQSKAQVLTNHSAGHISEDAIKNNDLMQRLVSLLSFGFSALGWALMGLPSGETAQANGRNMLQSMKDFKDTWKIKAENTGFISALNEHLAGIHKTMGPDSCTSTLLLPLHGIMPESLSCVECGRPMKSAARFYCD